VGKVIILEDNEMLEIIIIVQKVLIIISTELIYEDQTKFKRPIKMLSTSVSLITRFVSWPPIAINYGCRMVI
jgi:hypothetical protein